MLCRWSQRTWRFISVQDYCQIVRLSHDVWFKTQSLKIVLIRLVSCNVLSTRSSERTVSHACHQTAHVAWLFLRSLSSPCYMRINQERFSRTSNAKCSHCSAPRTYESLWAELSTEISIAVVFVSSSVVILLLKHIRFYNLHVQGSSY